MCFLTYIATRVPNGTAGSYSDLAAVLPVVIISAAGVTTLVVILICCIGYKLNYKYVRLQYPFIICNFIIFYCIHGMCM